MGLMGFANGLLAIYLSTNPTCVFMVWHLPEKKTVREFVCTVP